jgi:hypothetical protein
MIVNVTRTFGLTKYESTSTLALFKIEITKFLSKAQNLLSVVKDFITRYSLWYFSKP